MVTASAFDPTLLTILSQVEDPEIPAVSIIDLGIVRGATTERVTLTPTYTGCPASQVIAEAVRSALNTAGFSATAVVTELDPPWSTDEISEAGREKLRAYGIAPPPRGEARGSLRTAAAVGCPRCGSHNTEEISRFGSTPCKALWRCQNCAEPFDHFKCL